MAKHGRRKPSAVPPSPPGNRAEPRVPAPRLAPIDVPSFWEKIVDGTIAYLGGWWARKKALVQALLDDVLVYICFFVFVTLMKWILDFFSVDNEHHELRKWASIAADSVILCGLLRKIVILVLRH